jgi:hypothetical protein
MNKYKIVVYKCLIFFLFTYYISANDYEGYYLKYNNPVLQQLESGYKIEKIKKNKYEATYFDVEYQEIDEPRKYKLKKGNLYYDRSYSLTLLNDSLMSIDRDNNYKYLAHKVSEDEFYNRFNDILESGKVLKKIKKNFWDWEQDYSGKSVRVANLIGMSNPEFLEINDYDWKNFSGFFISDLYSGYNGSRKHFIDSANYSPGKNYKIFKGNVFGKETRISFNYDSDIIFVDIPSSQTGESFSSIIEWVPPEILEDNFDNYKAWSIVAYLSDKNCILFREKDNLKLIDFNKGSLRHNLNIWTKPEEKYLAPYHHRKNSNRTFYFSDHLPEELMLIAYYNQVKGDTLELHIFDIYNNKILKRYQHNFSNPPVFYKSVGNKLWMYGKRNENAIDFFQIDSVMDYKYSIFRTEENDWLFDNESEKAYYKYNLRGAILPKYKYVLPVFCGTSDHWPTSEYSSWDERHIKQFFGYCPRLQPVINNGLLSIVDSYHNIIIFDLKKNGIIEKKFSVIQIKNKLLGKDDIHYLNQFYSIGWIDYFYKNLAKGG